ncbi:SOS response-associated peptidase family protein [Nitrosospira sp. Nsp13]|uniref:SOS response-associated peptidase family protein n=1 Tax=Nitrosospira sp. Nsp13 TaxID=1855332 RepID=UPI000881CF23|nr:SOS response-associated peptidase family protein [Nitrosospira sp. Nsp13]SCY39368.1 SOS response associated peptidase (SRAP) [Nitrosospira sp. Nsp13]
MCGRYGLNHPHPVLKDWYRASIMPELKPRYNIAPTMEILAVLETEDSRIGSMMRWGIKSRYKYQLHRDPLTTHANSRSPICLIYCSAFWRITGDNRAVAYI